MNDESRPKAAPEHLRAQTTKEIVAQATDHADIGALTPATELDGPLIIHGVERAAEVALTTDQPAVFVGLRRGLLVVCDRFTCCGQTPGTFLVVPDVVLAELQANGHDIAGAGLWSLQRHDGRSVRIACIPLGEAVSTDG